MSGDFPQGNVSTVRFNETGTMNKQVERMLGKEFLSIFDEIFEFQPISMQHRMLIMNRMISGWKQKPSDEAIQHALTCTSSLEEASKYLKQSITHIG